MQECFCNERECDEVHVLNLLHTLFNKCFIALFAIII